MFGKLFENNTFLSSSTSQGYTHFLTNRISVFTSVKLKVKYLYERITHHTEEHRKGDEQGGATKKNTAFFG